MRICVLIGMILGMSVVAKAEAGHIDGNGTGGIAYSAENPPRVQIYDIWEGENQKFLLKKDKNLIFPEDTANAEVQRKRALERVRQVAPLFANEIDRCYWQFKKRMDFIPEAMNFSPPQDIDPTFLPVGGSLVRIASYNNQTNRILIDPNLFKGLSDWHKVALLFHEVVYRELRFRQTRMNNSSLSARLVTACAFAENCDLNELKARTNFYEQQYGHPFFYTYCAFKPE